MVSTHDVSAEIAIVGAGPHGLAVGALLVHAVPEMADRLVVLDPSGAWLERWRCQFARLEIANLRSPVVHHPGPDAGGLCRFVTDRALNRSGLPYDPPLSDPFASYCADLVGRYRLPAPVPGVLCGVERTGEGLRVTHSRGTLIARHVVLAGNPHRRVLPAGLGPAAAVSGGRVVHGDEVDLPMLGRLDGGRIIVVGGGLTAGHLAHGALRRGAREVVLVVRRKVELRNFDTDPGWLGPRNLVAWSGLTDPVSRYQAVVAARGGGTMPEWMWGRLTPHLDDDRLRVLEGREIMTVRTHTEGDGVDVVLDDGTVLDDVDRVWSATGTAPDLRVHPGLDDLLAGEHLVEGLPCPDDDLRVGRLPLFVVGRLAALALGPAAGNLWGAQRAARRIVRAVTGIEVDLSGRCSPASAGC